MSLVFRIALRFISVFVPSWLLFHCYMHALTKLLIPLKHLWQYSFKYFMTVLRILDVIILN